MALQGSGAISIYDINIELAYAGTRNSNLNESALRTLADVSSGTISLSNFYGKSSWPYNINNGWIAGGAIPAGNTTSIERMAYATEAWTTIGATLAVARHNPCGVHSSTHGYFMGGNLVSTVYTEIDGLVLSTEAANNPAAVLGTATSSVGGNSALSLTKGFIVGGYASYTYLTVIQGIVFSTEAAFTSSGALAHDPRGGFGTVSSDTKSFFMGGYNPTAPTYKTFIDCLLHSNETVSLLSATLSLGRSLGGGAVASETKGYALGGSHAASSFTAEIDGIVFSTETATNPAAALTVARSNQSGLSTREKGYACGGNNASNSAEVDGIQFSNEAAINPSAGLPTTRSSAGAFSGAAR